MSESEPEEQKIHEDTETLQDIAQVVEHEREEHGKSEFAESNKPDEQLMSDAAAHSEENPDKEAETREDH